MIQYVRRKNYINNLGVNKKMLRYEFFVFLKLNFIYIFGFVTSGNHKLPLVNSKEKREA